MTEKMRMRERNSTFLGDELWNPMADDNFSLSQYDEISK